MHKLNAEMNDILSDFSAWETVKRKPTQISLSDVVRDCSSDPSAHEREIAKEVIET